jgi:hypothetical protein
LSVIRMPCRLLDPIIATSEIYNCGTALIPKPLTKGRITLLVSAEFVGIGWSRMEKKKRTKNSLAA